MGPIQNLQALMPASDDGRKEVAAVGDTAVNTQNT
jgi:hypothetical protein